MVVCTLYNGTVFSPYDAFMSLPQDVAAYIKKEFDKKHNPTWYVLVSLLVVIFDCNMV